MKTMKHYCGVDIVESFLSVPIVIELAMSEASLNMKENRTSRWMVKVMFHPSLFYYRLTVDMSMQVEKKSSGQHHVK